MIVVNLFAAYNIYSQQYEQYFNTESLRFDFIHSGNFFSETLQLNNVKKEPYWGGNPNSLIDKTNYGNYIVEVFHLIDSNLLFSYGYGCLFQEWKYIKLAKTEQKDFQESLIIPCPKIPVKVKISARDSLNRFLSLYEFAVNPDTVKMVKSEYSPLFIHQSGISQNKIDVVIIGDGYKKKDYKKLLKDAEFLKESILSYRPFNQNKDKFNFILVPAFSKQRGISNPLKNKKLKTLLSCSFNTLDTERYLMTEEVWKLRDIAACTPYDYIFVLANTKEYGGGAIYNFYGCAASGDSYSGFVIVHEFGHLFAGLADEYVGDTSYDLYFSLHTEPWEPNITTLVDFESKWKDMLTPDIPIPTPEIRKYADKVGVFEGAGYRKKGVYRPVYDCTMRSVSIDNFCPVCSKAIIKMINLHTQ